MKHPDEAIDQVLRGLQHSDAPAGMDGRILRAMQARMADHAEQRARMWQAAWWLMPERRVGFGIALAGLLVLVTSISLVPRAAVTPVETTMARKVEPVQAPRIEIPQVLAQRGSRVNARVVLSRRLPRRAVAAHDAPDGDRLGALAREEMLAPSHPAPPLPMTAQEKLLRQAVMGSDLSDLAMLNPEERAKADAKADDEFKTFFGMKEPAKQERPVTPSETGDKPAEQPQDKAEPSPANDTSQSNSGRKD